MPLSNIKKRIRRNISQKLGLVDSGGVGGGKGGKSTTGRRKAVLTPPQASELKQTVSVAGSLDLLCEGPIGGAVNPRGIYADNLGGVNMLQSVYLNDVPVLETSENFSIQKNLIHNNFLLEYSHSGTTTDMSDISRYDNNFICEDEFLKYFVEGVNTNRELTPAGELDKVIFCCNGRPESSEFAFATNAYYWNSHWRYNGRKWYTHENNCFVTSEPDYFPIKETYQKELGKYYSSLQSKPKQGYGSTINFHSEAFLKGTYEFSQNNLINFVFNSAFMQMVDQKTNSGAAYQYFKYGISGSGFNQSEEPSDLNNLLDVYTGNAGGINCAIYDSKQLFDRSLYDLGGSNSEIENLPAVTITRRKPRDMYTYDVSVDPLVSSLYTYPADYIFGVYQEVYSLAGSELDTFNSYAMRQVGHNYGQSRLHYWASDFDVDAYYPGRPWLDYSGFYYQTENYTGRIISPKDISLSGPYSKDIPHTRLGNERRSDRRLFDSIYEDFKFPRISGSGIRWYDPCSEKLGGASSRETIPIKVENFEEYFLNGNYLRSGGHIFRTGVSDFIDESNIYSDRKIRNQTNAANPYEHDTKFVNIFNKNSYIKTGLTPNNTTGWILEHSGTPYYYFDNCIQKKFNYDSEEGYDLYSPQQFLRKRWTGSLEFTDSTALSLTGSPEFTQFQNNNAEDFSGGWVSYDGLTPGNVISILGTGYGDWKVYNPRIWRGSTSFDWTSRFYGTKAVVHFDDNSGISLDSKVTLTMSNGYNILRNQLNTGIVIDPSRAGYEYLEYCTLRDYITMETYVSGEIVDVLSDARLHDVFNQNPKFYDGSYSNGTVFFRRRGLDAGTFDTKFGPLEWHFPFAQTSFLRDITNTDSYSNGRYENEYHLHVEPSNFGVYPLLVKEGEICTNSNGDVCFPTKSFNDAVEITWAFHQIRDNVNLKHGEEFGDMFELVGDYDNEFADNPFFSPEILNAPVSRTKGFTAFHYKNRAFPKFDGFMSASVAGEVIVRDLYQFSQTAYNYSDVYAEFRNGEESQNKIKTFAQSKTENKVISDLLGPFRKVGGDARDGDGNTDTRSYQYYHSNGSSEFIDVEYANWTNQLPVDEDEISYTYIVDRSEVVKVECIIEITALQEVNHKSNQILPSFIDFEIEVGFLNLEMTNAYSVKHKGLVEPSSPFVTNLKTVDLPKYSEIQNSYPDKSLSFLKKNHKRYVKVRKKTYETESILISRSARTRAFNEIIDSNFTYPNSALAAMYFDAKTFTDPPKRTYDLRLKKCKIPSNYFPLITGGTHKGMDKRFLDRESDTKELIYSGDWDGSFKEDWTDNPAWVLYDILTNNSYGLGDYQDDIEDIDIFKLYQIGRYCDAVDSSGYFSGLSTNAGGLEPRYSCNILFEESFNGFDFVNAICNMFHGVAYWKNGSINFFTDKLEDVSATFDNSNVFDGIFSYSDMNKNNRFNFVEIEYKDKTDDFKTKVEYVEDEEDIRKKGIIKYKEGARGITSRSQARRYAKHILYSNKLETEGVQFQASQQSIIVEPGDIIQINDELKSFQRDSARLLEVDTLNNSIKIENTINTGAITTGEGVYISTPTGQTSLNDLYTGINFHDLSITDSVLSGYEVPQIINVDITGINQGTNHIELLLNENHEDIYRLGQAKLGQMCNVRITGAPENLYRVISIMPSENNLYQIVAKEYNPVKYKIIEEGEGLENNEYYNLPHIGLPANIIKRPPEPQGFSFSTGENNMYSINLSGIITGQVGGIEKKYRVSVTKPNGMYFSQEFEKDSTLSPPETYFEFKNLIGAGTYKIEVTSMLNPESSKTLQKKFRKLIPKTIYENPFLESVKINGEKYTKTTNISSVDNFSKDILIDLNYLNNCGLPYENKNHIKMNLLQGSTGHSFDIPELPVSITKDERDQIFGSAERTFTIQSYLEDSNGNIHSSPEITINHSVPKINSIRTLNNNNNLRLNIETENFKNLEKIFIYSGSNQDFEIGPESFLAIKPFHPQLNNEVKFGHQTTGEVYYKLIPYDCFGSGVLYTGFSEQINFLEPEVFNSYPETIYNTLFLNNSQNANGEFVFSQIFNIPQKDLVLKIGGTPNEDDCVVDLFLGQFSGRFMIPFNNNSYSNNIYFCSNLFAKSTENLLKFSSDLVDDNSVSGKLVSGDLSNLDLEIKA
jgi:hypothetical protein